MSRHNIGSALAGTGVGIGLRPDHVGSWLALRPPLPFVSLRCEDIGAPDGITWEALDALREHPAVALRCTATHARTLEAQQARQPNWVERLAPLWVSLRLDLVDESVIAPARGLQERLGRPVLLETPWHSLCAQAHGPDASTLVQALWRHTGCPWVLDLNALLVDRLNQVRRVAGSGQDTGEAPARRALHQAAAQALDFVWSLPPGAVGLIHLAGFRWPGAGGESSDAPIVADASQRVGPVAWSLYRQALEHLGDKPTSIEWGHDLPGLAVLLDEARLAAEVRADVQAAFGTASDREAPGGDGSLDWL